MKKQFFLFFLFVMCIFVMTGCAETKVKNDKAASAVAEEKEVLTESEIKPMIENSLNGIINSFKELGNTYQWSISENPADFNILQPELLKYATEEFTNGNLKEVAEQYYCECDYKFFPSVDFDIRLNVHEQTENKLVVSSIQFADE